MIYKTYTPCEISQFWLPQDQQRSLFKSAESSEMTLGLP